MTLLISWSSDSGEFDGDEFVVSSVQHVLAFDCVTTETHEASSEITEHAVERGAALSDHKKVKQRRISIEVVVTNTPLGAPPESGFGASPVSFASRKSPNANAVVRVYSGAFDRMTDVHDTLVTLAESPIECTISTRTRVYESAQIIGCTAPRTSDDGDSIRFVISAVEIRIAESRRVDLPTPREPRGRATRDAGTQATTEVDNRSAAARVVDAGGAQINEIFGI